MNYKAILVCLALLFPAVILQTIPANGEETQDKPWERFSLSLGGFLAGLSSNVRMGSDALGVGLDIDVEEALDMESTTAAFRTDILYRSGKTRHHRWDLNYFNFRRNATKVLGRDIEFQGQTYSVGTRVDSFLNIEIIKGGYSFSLFQDDRFDLAVGLGAYVMPIDVGLSSAAQGSRSESITAPLPVFSLRNDFAYTPKIFLRQNIEFFYLEMGQFEGLLTDVKIALEYNPWQHVGFGLGLDYLRLRIKADGEDYPAIDFVGDIKFAYAGLMLYAKYFF